MGKTTINWLAVVAAAIAIYAIGFIIYGLLVPPDAWMAGQGISEAQMQQVGESRMPFSVVMPVMTALFLAIIFRWAGVSNVADGVKWALAIGLASAIPALLYGWVYGVGPFGATLLDIGHLAAGHAAAGAILGGWRRTG